MPPDGVTPSTAKADLEHGVFTAMVEEDVPFGPRMAWSPRSSRRL
jgi:hypothetical protein